MDERADMIARSEFGLWWGNLPVEGHTVLFLRSDDSVIDIVQTDRGLQPPSTPR